MLLQIPPAEIQRESLHIHDNRRGSLISSLTICTVLAVVATGLRFTSRRISRASIQADDYWILVSLALLIGQGVAEIIAVQAGAGRHVILLKEPSKYAKTVVSLEVLYAAGTATVKYSVLCLYQRLFGAQGYIRIAVRSIACLVTAYSLVGVILVIFRCRPIRSQWEAGLAGKCFDLALPTIIVGVVNALTDLIALMLPVYAVWHLQMARRWKVQIVGIFLLGGFVVIGSIYRVTTLSNLGNVDATWDLVEPGIWAYVENAIGIVSACLPVLRPIYNLMVHRHHCNSNDECSRCSRIRESRARGGLLARMGRFDLSSTRSMFRRSEKPLPSLPTTSEKHIPLSSTDGWSTELIRP